MEIIDRLEKVETCEKGREYLLSLVGAGEVDIRPVGTYFDIPKSKRKSPKALVDDIVIFTVGARLNAVAIRGVAL